MHIFFEIFNWTGASSVKYGTSNLLEVDVAKHSSDASVNRAEREADFWIFGGIYRPVFLEVKPGLHLERVAIDAMADGSFRVLSVLKSKKVAGKVKVELYDLEGSKLNGEFETTVEKGNIEVLTEGKFDGKICVRSIVMLNRLFGLQCDTRLKDQLVISP